MRRILFAIFVFSLVFPLAVSGLEKGLTIRGVRYFTYPTFTRIVLELDTAAPYTVNRSPDGRAVVVAAYEGPLAVKAQLPAVRDGIVSGIETREDAGRQVIMIRLEPTAGDVKDFVLRGPDRIVMDILKAGQAATGPAPPAAAVPVPEKQATIMLDAGHGGRDSGLVTGQGQEKTANLELALAVKKLLQKDARFKVVQTRDRDVALTLDERAAAANHAAPLIFVSIHASAAGSGSRVYIQDPDDDVQEQAQRPLTRDFLGFEAGSEQQNFWGAQQAAHARQSGALGRILARQLAGNTIAEPVQAPLAQLKPVDAAAVLVEIAADQDRTSAAEALARGIEAYVRENR